MADFTSKSAIFRAPERKSSATASRAPIRIASKMAELLMNSATVELGRMPTRELPRYWTPWLFALLL